MKEYNVGVFNDIQVTLIRTAQSATQLLFTDKNQNVLGSVRFRDRTTPKYVLGFILYIIEEWPEEYEDVFYEVVDVVNFIHVAFDKKNILCFETMDGEEVVSCVEFSFFKLDEQQKKKFFASLAC